VGKLRLEDREGKDFFATGITEGEGFTMKITKAAKGGGLATEGAGNTKGMEMEAAAGGGGGVGKVEVRLRGV
jgi:hypothetical protein